MKIRLPEKIDRNAWASFLKMKESDFDARKIKEMDSCEKLLFEAASPKGIYIYSDKLDYEGLSIKKHLADCRSTVIMGTTLGPRVDEMIVRLAVKAPAMAVYADSGAGVLADMVTDILENEIKENLPDDTPYMTGRFSPGYGDLPLKTQRELIAKLDAPRKIGLTLNYNDLMIPMKSVTAIIGISDVPVKGRPATCRECLLYEECEKRKEGRICE